MVIDSRYKIAGTITTVMVSFIIFLMAIGVTLTPDLLLLLIIALILIFKG